MTLDSAVNLAALLAGIDPASLDATTADPRAALTARLAGIRAPPCEHAREGAGSGAAHARREGAARV